MIGHAPRMLRPLDAWRAAHVVVGLLSSGAHAGAAEVPLSEVVVNAPSHCMTPEQLSASVNALLDKPTSLRGVSVQLTEHPGSWRARLNTPEGERTIEGESCQALADAVAAVLALAAAPAGDADASVEELPSDGAEQVNVGVERVNVAPEPHGASERGLVLSVRVLVTAEVGMLPGPSLGPRLVLALGQGRSSVEISASALLARSAALPGARAPAGDIHWLGGHVAACRELRATLSTCLGGEMGQLVGKGSGVDEPLTARGTWLAAVVGASWSEPFWAPEDPLRWEIALSAAFALVRPEFGFDGLGVLHRASAVSGRFSLGLGWR